MKHFSSVAAAVESPILLYNVPGRTVTSLSIESIEELSLVKNIVGIKEASGDINFLQEIKKRVSENFILLSGDDGTYIEFLKTGGHGVISVTSHIFPKAMKRWFELVASGQSKTAHLEFEKYKKLTDLMFAEANPIPVKATLKMMNILEQDDVRLPLVELEEKWRKLIQVELKNLALLT